MCFSAYGLGDAYTYWGMRGYLQALWATMWYDSPRGRHISLRIEDAFLTLKPSTTAVLHRYHTQRFLVHAHQHIREE